ncbi:MAG: hypothetical protein COA70_06495 [Planctomycetota bacterium]|nr:MAG: hypothetical protein COA70_06495 [Planctomycetota bacterium]
MWEQWVKNPGEGDSTLAKLVPDGFGFWEHGVGMSGCIPFEGKKLLYLSLMRSISAGLGLLALGLLVFIFWPAAKELPAPLPEASTELEARDAASYLSLSRSQQVGSALEELERIPETPTHRSTASTGFRIQVLSHHNDIAIPDAEVFFFAQSRLKEEQFRVNDKAMSVTPHFLLEQGVRGVTDKDGLLSYLPAEGMHFVMARSGWRYNLLRMEPKNLADAAPMRLMVKWPVAIKVVDLDGIPLEGVSVALASKLEDSAQPGWRTGGDQVSDNNGDAILGFGETKGWGLPIKKQTLFASAYAPGHAPVVEEVSYAELTPKPITLQLAGSGRILFKVLGDKSFAGKVTAVAWKEELAWGLSNRQNLRKDRAIFRNLGLGQKYRIVLRLEGASKTMTKIVKGPTHHGQDVLVTMDIGTPLELRGRLVQANGTPRSVGTGINPSKNVEYLIDGSKGVAGYTRIGRSGDFKIVLAEDWKGEQMHSITFYWSTHGPTGSKAAKPEDIAWSSQEIPIDDSLDLGDLVWGAYVQQESVVAAQGRVVNAGGEGVENVLVVAGNLQMNPSRDLNKRGLPAIADDLFRGITDETGHFAILGHPMGGALQVQAFHSDFPPTILQSFPFGEQEIELELLQSGSVLTRLTWPPIPKSDKSKRDMSWSGFSFSSKDIHVRETGLIARLALPQDSWFEADSWITSYGLWSESPPMVPGIYRLGIFLNGAPQPFHEVKNVEVKAGQAIRLEDDFPLDLSRFLARTEIIVRAADESEMEATPMVELLHGSQIAGVFHPRLLKERNIKVHFPSTVGVQLRITCPGFITRLMDPVAGKMTVTLERVES